MAEEKVNRNKETMWQFEKSNIWDIGTQEELEIFKGNEN
jgi:hypothetical protein